MKRFTVSLLAFLMIVSLFLVQPALANEEKIVLTVPHWYWSHGSAFGNWLTQASDAFVKENPNVVIEPVVIAYEEYWSKLDTAIAAGTPYDIMAFGDNVGSYIANDHLLPLNEYIDMEDINTNFDTIQTKTVPALADDGKTYIISNVNAFYMPIYRPSVLKKAGWDNFPMTYDELLRCSEDLLNAGITPFALMTNPGNFQEQATDIMIWSIAQGNNFVVDGKPMFTSDAVVGAYTCIKEMYDKNYIVKDVDKGTYRGMLGTGEVGILFDGPWTYGIMYDADPSCEGDVAVANTSFFPAHLFSAGWEGFAVSSKTKHPEMAAKYIEFLTSKQQMTEFTKIVGIVSNRTDVFDEKTTAEVLELYPWFKGFIEGAPNSISNSAVGFPADRIQELRKISGWALETILYENANIMETLTKAQSDAEAL
ncbi:MAG: extracellular solute-binding protein, partial [Clostridia bacterium]|nr:extracellular solute-binding protein [Clostridia bacterium]